jgi:hypothetical protein
MGEKVIKRNKLIRIADTSEGSWQTVQQYESNPIASDSDDESKISKAENRALWKRKRTRGLSEYGGTKVSTTTTQLPE